MLTCSRARTSSASKRCVSTTSSHSQALVAPSGSGSAAYSRCRTAKGDSSAAGWGVVGVGVGRGWGTHQLSTQHSNCTSFCRPPAPPRIRNCPGAAPDTGSAARRAARSNVFIRSRWPTNTMSPVLANLRAQMQAPGQGHPAGACGYADGARKAPKRRRQEGTAAVCR